MPPSTPHHFWAYRLAMGIIVAGIVAMGAMGLSLLGTRNVAQVSSPMPVSPSQVRSGDWVTLTVHYYKSHEYDSLVGMLLASEGRVILLPAMISALPAGEHHIRLMVQIPAGTPPAEYVLYVTAEHAARAPFPWLGGPPLVVPSVPFTVIP